MKLLSLVCFASIVHTCGVAVHLELVDRLAPILPKRISQHRDFIRSGAFYPDAFYNCRGQYDVAEDAHWPPFLGVGVEIVHERKRKGLDTSQLEAFLIGILSHQVSDVSWHSLGLFQGLLQAMADSEFDGDYNKAHSVLDIGGDMVQLSRRTPNRKDKNAKWDYNVEDIEELVSRAGYTNIPRTSIHYCMARGQAAYTGELKVADIAHKRFSRRSPTMFDELESYFTGGLTDMHEQIEECLPELIRWMSNGVDKENYWDICPVFAGRKRESEHDHDHVHYNSLDLVEETLEEVVRDERNENLSHENDNSEEEDQAVILKRALGAEFVMEILHDSVPEVKKKLTRVNNLVGGQGVSKTQILSCDIIPVPEISEKRAMDPTDDSNVATDEAIPSIAEVSHPLFGSNVVFWGDDKLVISSPAENIVYVYSTAHTVQPELIHTIRSPHPAKKWGELVSHFGSSVALWDNKYLIVGSPGISTIDFYDTSLRWSGGLSWANVTTLYGGAGLKMIGETLATHLESKTLYVGSPRSDFNCTVIEIVGSEPLNCTIEQAGIVYALDGDIITTAIGSKEYVELSPLDHVLYSGESPYQRAGMILTNSPEEILVGCPGTEEVLGFKHGNHETGTIVRNKPESLNTLKPSGFGGHFIGANQKYLVIGAPAGSLNEKSLNSDSQEGVLVVYTLDETYMIAGNEEFSWFGTQGILDGDRVYMVSPHAKSGEGMLWEVDLRTKSIKELGVPEQSFASGFGAAFASNGDIWAIGMPQIHLEQKSRRGGVAITHLTH